MMTQMERITLIVKLNSSSCDYSDAYILVRETITFAALVADWENNGIHVVFKNCAQFTDCISEKTTHK